MTCGFSIRIASLPPDVDPNDLGTEGVRPYIAAAQPLSDSGLLMRKLRQTHRVKPLDSNGITQ